MQSCMIHAEGVESFRYRKVSNMSLLTVTAIALLGAAAANAQGTWMYSANTITHTDGWKLNVTVVNAQSKTLSVTGCTAGPTAAKPLNLADPISGDYTIVGIASVPDKTAGGVLGTYASKANRLVLPETLLTIGRYSFYRCTACTGDLTLPDSLLTIDLGAFRECDGFTGSLNFGRSLTSIGESAFLGCTGFTKPLWIPDSVKTIAKMAFQDTLFPRVSINSTGLSLDGNQIFGGNTALVMIYFRGGYPAKVDNTAFSAGAKDNPNLVIYVLPEYVDEWNAKGLKDGLLKFGPITETTTTAIWPQGGNGNNAGNPIRIGTWTEEVYFFHNEQWIHVDAITLAEEDDGDIDVDLMWDTAQITIQGSYKYAVYASTNLTDKLDTWRQIWEDVQYADCECLAVTHKRLSPNFANPGNAPVLDHITECFKRGINGAPPPSRMFFRVKATK